MAIRHKKFSTRQCFGTAKARVGYNKEGVDILLKRHKFGGFLTYEWSINR